MLHSMNHVQINFSDKIKNIIQIKNSQGAFLLASSIPLMRTPEIFEVIAQCPLYSFKALKYIDNAKNYSNIIFSAATIPRQARVILEDMPQYLKNKKIVKTAIDNHPYWEKYYSEKSLSLELSAR